MRRAPIILFLPILALAASATGGPLRPDRLPADAAWVVHADLELAASTKLGRFTLGLIDEELAETTIGELKIHAGGDVRDVTLFGWADEEAGGIVMATMTDAADRLIQHVKERDTYHRLEHNGKPIHSWIECAGAPVDAAREREAERGGASMGAAEAVRIYALELNTDSGRLVLATDSIDALLKATGVIEDDAASRADAADAKAARLPVELPEGAFFFFATTEPRPFGAEDPAAQVAKLAEVVTLNAGERDNEGFVNLSVSARTEQEAAQIAQVLQGLAALAQMMIPPDDQELAWLRTVAGGLAFTAEGLYVTAACAFDPDMVIEGHTKAREEEAPEQPPDGSEQSPDDPEEKEDASP